MKGKLGKMSAKIWVLLIIVTLVVGIGAYTIGKGGEKPIGTQISITPGTAGTGGGTQQIQVVDTSCGLTPNFLGTGINAFTKVPLTESMILYENDQFYATKSGDTNIPIAKGVRVSGIINASGYCPALIEKTTVNDVAWKNPDGSVGAVGVIPCKSPVNPIVPLSEFILDGSSTSATLNSIKDPTDQPNSVTANYSVGVNSKVTFKWTYDAPSNRGMCNGGTPRLTCLIEKSNFTLVEASASRGELTAGASKPAIVTQTAVQDAYSWDWKNGVIEDDGNPVTFALTFTTFPSGGPADGQTTNELPFCTINDQAPFQNQQTGLIQTGFNDESNANVGIRANVINATFYMR